MSCFRKDTKFFVQVLDEENDKVSTEIKSFEDFENNEEITVYGSLSGGRYGWKTAVVKEFPRSYIYEMKIFNGKEFDIIYTTHDHNWSVYDKRNQTNVKMTSEMLRGDRFETIDGTEWKFHSLTCTSDIQSVWCCVVSELHDFTLSNSIVTKNCSIDTFVNLKNNKILPIDMLSIGADVVTMNGVDSVADIETKKEDRYSIYTEHGIIKCGKSSEIAVYYQDSPDFRWVKVENLIPDTHRLLKYPNNSCSIQQIKKEDGQRITCQVTLKNSETMMCEDFFFKTKRQNKRQNKCVSSDTLIITKEGTVPIHLLRGKIKEIYNGDSWVRCEIKKADSDVEFYSVYFSNGFRLKVTSTHQFAIVKGGDRIDSVYTTNLKKGMVVPQLSFISDRFESENNSCVKNNEAFEEGVNLNADYIFSITYCELMYSFLDGYVSTDTHSFREGMSIYYINGDRRFLESLQVCLSRFDIYSVFKYENKKVFLYIDSDQDYRNMTVENVIKLEGKMGSYYILGYENDLILYGCVLTF